MISLALILGLTVANLRSYQDATISQVLHEECSNNYVRIRGIIVDAFPDETSDQYTRLCLYDNSGLLDVATRRTFANSESLLNLVNTSVDLYGQILPQLKGVRQQKDPILIDFTSEDLITWDARQKDPPAPPLGDTAGLGPTAVKRLGRRETEGIVRATWQGSWMLIKTVKGQIVKIHLAHGFNPPNIGQVVKVTGIAETDTIDIQLSHSIWKPSDRVIRDDVKPVAWIPDVNAYSRSGDIVRANGIVRYFRRAESMVRNTLILDVRGIPVEIDPGACEGLLEDIPLGSELEVTGCQTFMVQTELSNLQYAVVRGSKIIVRTPDDVRVLARPSWWTPLRLTVVIAVMLLVIVAILIWNRSLQILANRKSRELFKAQITKAESELRLDERTRLAAELHDYTAQNLTAISYQIAAAEDTRHTDGDASDRYLQNAGKMLKSTLTDLRRCLWDLKNDTLGNPNFGEAIRETVLPVSGDADVRVRFGVKRAHLSDKVAHAVLSICRELVSNAVRHGKAGTIHIVGEIRDGQLRFMVHDNGTGFDPDNREKAVGHFGLDGIAERVKRLEGKLSINSASGSGTKVIVSIPRILPKTECSIP